MESLFLSDTSRPSLRVHPLAAVSITHALMRQTKSSAKIFGGLIGTIKGDTVEIVDSFQVPCTIKDNDEMDFKEDYLEKMVDFSKRFNKKESIVGWYMGKCDGEDLFDNFIRSINSRFVKYCLRTPIHLVVSVGADNMLHYCGYIGRNITNVFTEAYWNNRNPQKPAIAGSAAQPASSPDTQFSFMFESLNVEVVISDSEAACLHHMIHNQTNASAWNDSSISAVIPDSSVSVKASLEQLLNVIDKLDSYVTGVVDGKRDPIAEVGMGLSDVLGSMEAVSKDSIEETYRDRLHEMLMVSYLSSLTKAQLQIADKIDTIL